MDRDVLKVTRTTNDKGEDGFNVIVNVTDRTELVLAYMSFLKAAEADKTSRKAFEIAHEMLSEDPDGFVEQVSTVEVKVKSEARS